MAELNNRPETDETTKTVLIVRTFAIPLSKLWAAWTEEDLLKKWWGPKGFTCPHYDLDPKVGGSYLACMKADDGKEVWSTGTFREIKPERLLVYTDSFSDSDGNIIDAADVGMAGNWPRELLITVDFETAGGNSKLTLKHAGIPAPMYDDCTDGWQSSLDKLEEQLK